MRLILCENYDEVSQKAAEIVASQIILKPDCVLGLATGSTPLKMYDKLAEMNKSGKIDFSEVKTFNLDEYYPIEPTNDQSYRYFMDKNFFSKINININNTHIPDGTAKDTDVECENYEKKIKASGGIDLQILGIGQNGHIGFNEPEANLNSVTHLTKLTENTIAANSRFFENIDSVPKKALTMGVGSILGAKKIILLASGASKHKVVKELIKGGVSTDVPASMLKLHNDVVLICDKAAYSSERIGIDIGGTEVKFGVFDDNNSLLYKTSIPTDCSSEQALIDSLVNECNNIMKNYSVTAIGIGTPGIIRKGCITAVNVPFNDTNLKKLMEEKFSVPVAVGNDANCATLGISVSDVCRDFENIIMITLGTGIGGGIISNGKILQGKGSAGEIGHICIEPNGKPCPCGKKGCFERYASTGALVNIATKAAEEHKESILYKLLKKNENLNGKLFFEALEANCSLAKEIFEKYLDYLALGINNLINIFDPDLIVISGGITGAGNVLLEPLVKKVNSDVPIKISELVNDAGILGASLLQ